MSSTQGTRAVDWLIGIPTLLLLFLLVVILTLICLPPYLVFRSFVRSMCPKCRVPFSRRVLSEKFDRPNVKFNVDHYIVACECRWCSAHWNVEVLRDVGY